MNSSDSPTTPVVFAISREAANEVLIKNGATEKQSKEVWLLRESSVPGLLTIVYYDKETNKFQNQRVGYKNGKWSLATSDNEEAKIFLKDATPFFTDTTHQNKRPELKTLLSYLTTKGFNSTGRIDPQNKAYQSERYEIGALEAKTGYSEFPEDRNDDDNDNNNNNSGPRP